MKTAVWSNNVAIFYVVCVLWALGLINCVATDPPTPIPDYAKVCTGNDCPPISSTLIYTTAGDGQVLLEWDAVPGAVGYVVYRCEMEIFCDESPLKDVQETFWLDTENLVNNYTYYYWVIAHDGKRRVAQLGPQRATPRNIPAPENFQCVNHGTELAFQWTQNWEAMEHSGFQLFGAAYDPTPDSPGNRVAVFDALATSGTVAREDTDYAYFALRAVREVSPAVSWQSEASAIVGCLPNSPSGLRLASSSLPNSLVVQWIADAWPQVVGDNNYTVYWRRDDSDGDLSSMDVSCESGSQCAATVENLTPNAPYNFWVVANNAAGSSAVPPATGQSVQGRVTYNEITGILDAGFGTNGIASTPVGYDGWGYIYDMVLQNNGSIAVAGWGEDDRAFVQRLGQQGTVDTSYGAAGMSVVPLGERDNEEWSGAHALATQPDGKLIIGGFTEVYDEYYDDYFAVARLLTDGSLDSSFGDGGIVRHTMGGDDARVYDIAVQSDGKIVAVGTTHQDYTMNAAISRYTDRGALDTSFGNQGKVVVGEMARESGATNVAILPNGKILVGGTTRIGDKPHFMLIQLNADGSIDSSFGFDGHTNLAIGEDGGEAFGMTVQPDGKILMAGYTSTVLGSEAVVARFLSNGDLDTAYGLNGVATTEMGWGYDVALISAIDVAVQPDGKIVIAGTNYRGHNYDLFLTRYTANGHLDMSFGTNGVVLHQENGVDYDIATLIVQPDGKILVAGTRLDIVNNNEYVVMRFQ